MRTLDIFWKHVTALQEPCVSSYFQGLLPVAEPAREAHHGTLMKRQTWRTVYEPATLAFALYKSYRGLHMTARYFPVKAVIREWSCVVRNARPIDLVIQNKRQNQIFK
jgi:hypothetical protein